jgi:hypothetical protein
VPLIKTLKDWKSKVPDGYRLRAGELSLVVDSCWLTIPPLTPSEN